MGRHKDSYLRIVPVFLAQHRALGRQLLEALSELCQRFPGEKDPGEKDPDEVELDRLIDRASTFAALRDPNRPLDQKRAREASVTLFRTFQAARLGKLIVGRRGHPTRFRFSFGPDADGGTRALRHVLAALQIQTPSSLLDKEFDQLPPVQHSADRVAAERPRKQDVVARLKAKSAELHQLGVGSLALFGSVARDDARPDSDVDLLATFDLGVTSDAFFDTKFFLEDLLGRRVDLVTDAALRERIRAAIEPELIRVA